MSGHWFWWTVTMTCVAWYTVLTGYVAVKGAADIKHMLRELSSIGQGKGGFDEE